LCICKKWKGNT